MVSLVKSEYIKGRHSFSRKSIIIFPLFVSIAAIVLMGGQYVQIGAFNWWTILLFPAALSLFGTQLIETEKKNGFTNIRMLPKDKFKTWTAKIMAGCSYVFIANLIMFCFTSLAGFLFGNQYTLWKGLEAAVLLTLTTIWQIPAGMYITAKAGSIVTFTGILLLNSIGSIQTVAGGRFWFIPFAIPSRLIAPIIGINPNGVALEADSPLWNTGVILPGILISISLFAVLIVLTGRWFERWGD